MTPFPSSYQLQGQVFERNQEPYSVHLFARYVSELSSMSLYLSMFPENANVLFTLFFS